MLKLDQDTVGMFDLQGLATCIPASNTTTHENLAAEAVARVESQPCTVCNWALKPWTRRVGKNDTRNSYSVPRRLR